MNPPPEPPTIAARDLSYHEAVAGIKAREEAAQSGGDPAQLRALVAAARMLEGAVAYSPSAPALRGRPLRQDDLLVSLCLGLYMQAFGIDPRERLKSDDTVENMKALAELVFIFTQAESAWDLLDRATDSNLEQDDREGWKRDFRRATIEAAGDLLPEELGLFNMHLETLARRRMPAVEDETPGKRPPPAPAAP